MRTKTILVRTAAALLLVGSTLGARVPPAHAEPVPFEMVPSVGFTTSAEGTISPSADWSSPDESIADEIGRQYEYDLARWTADLAREAEQAAAAERAAAATRARPTVRAAPTAAFTPDVWQIIADAASRHQIDPVRFARIAYCESRGDPTARNPSGAAGLFQQMPQYWASRSAAAGIPGAWILDPWANAEVSAWLYATGGTSHWAESRPCWG